MQDIGLISHTFEKNSSVIYILNSISGVKFKREMFKFLISCKNKVKPKYTGPGGPWGRHLALVSLT